MDARSRFLEGAFAPLPEEITAFDCRGPAACQPSKGRATRACRSNASTALDTTSRSESAP